jgi:hypothetical protein
MKSVREITKLRIAAVTLFTSFIVACGGGGGGGGGGGEQVAELPPSSGSYAPVVVGDQSSIFLSAAHASAPTTEYAWSSKPVNATAMRISNLGKIATDGRVTDLQPFELSTIQGTDIGSVSLIAGGRPVHNTFKPVQRPCRFNTAEGWLQFRLDFTPTSGTLTDGVVMAGSDGVCGTADDAPAIEEPIGEFFDYRNGDQATVLQNGIVSIQNKGSSSSLSSIASATGGAPLRRIVNLDNAAVAENASGLYLVTMKDKTTESAWDFKFDLFRLKTVSGWKNVGYDVNAIYLYRNTSTSGLGTWEFLQITRSDGTMRTLGTGTGTVEQAAMSANQIWIAVLNNSSLEMHALYKNLSQPKVTLSSSTSIVKIPIVSAGNRMVVYAVRPGFSGIEVYNEGNANTPVRSIPQSFLSGFHRTGVLSIRSTPSQAVMFVKNPSNSVATGFAGGVLSSYDPATDAEINYGTLPQGPIAGANLLIGVASTNDSGYKTFVLQGVSTGANLPIANGARKFSFQFGTANSLQELSRQYVLVP